LLTQTPRGTKDIYGEQMLSWLRVEDIIRSVCKTFCAEEIRTPIFEHTELFLRGVGETTDVVQKEMYTFLDKGERSITLRPEGTAGVARAFIEHKMYAEALPKRFYYIGPIFRYERPAQGRYRQHHQFGVEILGSYDAAADAEVIMLGNAVLSNLGLTDYQLRLNSLGGTECRARYNGKLREFLHSRLEQLCPTCQARAEKNPLRVLDCKDPNCQDIIKDAPVPLDSLDMECAGHFAGLRALLDSCGISYEVDGRIVRGLDYYTRTVFEFVDKKSGLTIMGGGRYDNLMQEVGGPATGAAGFGMGIERILSMLPEAGPIASHVYVGSMGEAGQKEAIMVVNKLRLAGISAQTDIAGRGVKAQLKYADKTNASHVIIIGDNEIGSRAVTVKEMATGTQTQVDMDNLPKYLLQR
jgi:histidyl-tRNA synthetase